MIFLPAIFGPLINATPTIPKKLKIIIVENSISILFIEVIFLVNSKINIGPKLKNGNIQYKINSLKV